MSQVALSLLTVELASLFVPFASYGQTISGTIAGTIVDSQQATIQGAAVTATEERRNLTLTATTNDAGGFVFTQVPPGTYTLSVEAPGFKKLEREGVTLNANDKLDIGNLAMTIGGVSESVEVSTQIVALQTESAERSEALVSKQIENIAVNGRSPLDMSKLVPGVVSTANFQTASWSGVGSISANGTRPNQNLLTINGISVIDPGANSTQNTTLSIDAVQEFKMLTGVYQAEYGRSAGAQISFVTKSGTSAFHGSAYEYVRNNYLNANTWLNNRQGVARPLYHYNDPGYTIGGPIYIPNVLNTNKDKLFFFWSQEFQRQITPEAIKFATVPTTLERQGNFSQSVDSSGKPLTIIDPNNGVPFAGNIIPQNRLYAPGIAALNLFPLPNAANNISFNYQSADSDPNPRREDLLRVDYDPMSKLRVFGHWIRNVNPVSSVYGRGPGITSIVPIGNDSIIQNLPAYSYAFGVTYIFNPTMTNEFNFGSSHHDQRIYQVGDNLTRTASGIELPVLYPSAVQNDYIPTLSFGGSRLANSPTVSTGDSPWGEFDTSFDTTDNLSKVIGGHVLKTGVYIQRNRKDQYSFGNNNGSYNFGDNSSNPYDTGYGFSNAALGVYNQFTQANAYVKGDYHYTNVELFAQDTWKVNGRLTVDYGLRAAWYQPWYDASLLASTFVPSLWTASNAPHLYQPALVNDQRSAFDPATSQTLPAADIGLIVPGTGSITNGIRQAGSGISKYMSSGPRWNWGPRLGIAWSVANNIVIRTGGGIFYDRIQGNRIFNQVTNPPTSTSPSFNYGFAQNLTSGGALLAPPTLYAVDPTAKVPTVYDYTFGIQSKLPYGMVLDSAYVGSQSRHLQDNRNINAVPYGAAFLPQNQDPTLVAAHPTALLGANALPVNLLRPYPGFSDIVLYEGAATANYNALEVALNRRFNRGLFLGISYTWSHDLTTDSTDTTYARVDQYQREANYGPSTYDRRQNFVANFIYDIPEFAHNSKALHAVADGWQISGVVRFQMGIPYTPCFNISGIGTCTIGLVGTPLLTGSYTESARIAVVPGCNPNTGSNSPYDRINAACFAEPQPGSRGLESGINYLTAPGTNNWDLSLQKTFVVKERLNMQFRVDAFNAFNHTQFTGINNTLNFSSLTNPTPTNLPYNASGQLVNVNGFGTVNLVADPRILQAMIRIQF